MQHNEAPTVERLYGNVASLLNFTVNFNDSGIASGVRKFRIAGTTARPVLLEVLSQVETVFNAATTNVLTLGTDAASANQILAAGDITEGTAGFYPATGFIAKQRITTTVDIYVKFTQTGTAATTGKAHFYFRLTPLEQPINPIAGI
jgi:hypothetical protein